MEEVYSQISSVLVNSFFIPLIKKGGESLANGIGDNMHDKVNGIYSKIRDKFRDDNDSKVIERFEEKPETYAKPIEELLKGKMMITDTKFASTVQSLFNEISKSPTVITITEDIEADGSVTGQDTGNIKKGDVTSVTRRVKAKDVIGGKYGDIGSD